MDGLRGLAILAVVVHHLFAANPVGPWSRAFQEAKAFGVHGVDLFFVLSGFLITGILSDSLGDSGYLRKFYARRSVRIFPLYYGALLALFLLTPVLHLQWKGMQWVYLTYLQNTSAGTAVRDFDPGGGIYIDHFWSLAVEEQFYLVWPLLVSLLALRRRILLVAATLSVGAIVLRFAMIVRHVDGSWIARSTPSRADSLLIGAVLALLLRGPRHDRVLRLAPAVLLSSCGAYAGFLLLDRVLPASSVWLRASDTLFLALGYTLLALASAALLALCLRPASRTQRLFSNPFLRFYGKYSYGLYVLHGLALPFLIGTFRTWFESFSPNRYLSIGGSGILVILISTLAAFLSYNLFEKHFLRLKRYFEYDRRPARDRSARTVST